LVGGGVNHSGGLVFNSTLVAIAPAVTILYATNVSV
jgi:hypothetical protein